MNKKGGLGKGLGAIFGENPSPISEPKAESRKKEDDNKPFEIAIKDINANPYQPRDIFDEEKLQELADSIKEYGIVQPLIVRRNGKRYELVAGERRLRAARLADIKKVPVVIREYTDEQMMEIALVENIQRHDLNPIEEAQGLRRLMTECKLTQEQAAAKVGRSRAAVANILRLLNLAQPVQDYIVQGILTMGQVKQLLSLSEQQQCEVAKAIIENGWSARTTEEVVRLLKEGKQIKLVREIVEAAGEEKAKEKTARAEEKTEADNVFCMDFQNRLIELLGTKVKVLPKRKDKNGQQGGVIEIEYYSEDDLERIYDVLEKKNSLPQFFKTNILNV